MWQAGSTGFILFTMRSLAILGNQGDVLTANDGDALAPRPTHSEGLGAGSADRDATSAGQAIDLTLGRPAEGIVVVEVSGEVDMLTAPVLASSLHQHVNDDRVFVVDLTKVTFLGSAGLAVLVEALHESRRAHVLLRLVVASRTVRRALTVTGLSEVFDIYSTVAEAIAAPADAEENAG
jgi:anti-sigma B factor antagonist